jgi:predicted transcriptional regulator
MRTYALNLSYRFWLSDQIWCFISVLVPRSKTIIFLLLAFIDMELVIHTNFLERILNIMAGCRLDSPGAG